MRWVGSGRRRGFLVSETKAVLWAVDVWTVVPVEGACGGGGEVYVGEW